MGFKGSKVWMVMLVKTVDKDFKVIRVYRAFKGCRALMARKVMTVR